VACIAIEESARASPDGLQVGASYSSAIASLVDGTGLAEPLLWDLVPLLQTLRRQCQAMANAFVEHGRLSSNKVQPIPTTVQGEPNAGPDAFSFLSAVEFVETEFVKLNSQLSTLHRNKAAKLLRDTRDSLSDSIEDFRRQKENHERRIMSTAASATLWIADLGAKLNPIIQGIMAAVKVHLESF
jgi:TATA-binding protein-associated factor